jgi:hypothetical protein
VASAVDSRGWSRFTVRTLITLFRTHADPSAADLKFHGRLLLVAHVPRDVLTDDTLEDICFAARLVLVREFD